MTNKKLHLFALRSKAGTTTLHNILRQHSEIFLPQNKEIPFFHDDNKFEKGIDWWLKENYHNVKHEKAIGVINPEYLFFPKACERIYKHLGPEIKIIIVIRNPVDRAYSQYIMNIRRVLKILALKMLYQRKKIGILSLITKKIIAIYQEAVLRSNKRFLTTFPKDNFLFLSFENDIVKNRDLTLKKIEDFWG